MESTSNTTPNSERLLTRRDVERRVALCKASIYNKIREGTFPAPLTLSVRCVRWRESQIDAWLNSHISAAEGGV